MVIVDEVVEKVTAEWEVKGDKLLSEGEQEFINVLDKYCSNESMSTTDKDDAEYLAMVRYKGLSLDDLHWSMYISFIGREVLKDKDITSLEVESAYDLLFNSRGDCNSNAYIKQAIYVALGKNTRIMRSRTQAWCEVQINGTWFNTDGGISLGSPVAEGVLIEETFANWSKVYW